MDRAWWVYVSRRGSHWAENIPLVGAGIELATDWWFVLMFVYKWLTVPCTLFVVIGLPMAITMFIVHHWKGTKQMRSYGSGQRECDLETRANITPFSGQHYRLDEDEMEERLVDVGRVRKVLAKREFAVREGS